ncbi:Rpn family recombination-promoting nuclease/putative transposase [Chamaesiphon sp.]|uniref:Rpn family recombination-promoting nuclease/putative transposase n=1 Tax=Chamaesiphon sp. TaxID=2814140 RepID=UPI003593BDD3
MRRDTIFYQLFRQSPTLLFDLIDRPPSNAAQYIFDSIEVKETAFRIDGVFVPPNSSGIVYFCEVQFQLDELLYERMLSEISIYTYRQRERFSDWQAVVIYPSRSIEQSQRAVVREILTSGRIIRVYLDELGTVQELPTGLGLMVLTTLEGDAAKAEARRLVGQAQGSRDIINLVSTIVLYKFDTLSRDEVDLMLGIELQQTRVYRDAFAEGEVRGLERGLQQERGLVLKLLNRKLGNIHPEIQARVSSLTIEQIESLGEDLLDFTQMGDLLAWLDTHRL